MKSSDVLDVTHEARSGFRGQTLGYFRRIGPNTWDDYQFVRAIGPGAADAPTEAIETGGGGSPAQIEVLPRVPLQLERIGAEVRLRSKGRVVRIRWIPGALDLELLGDQPDPRAMRRYFVETYLAAHGEGTLMGPGAVIACKLSDS